MDRIKILDGFRALAIISVMLFHYFSRYTTIGLYPYKDRYDFFSLGALGVQFFFIISGFVIYFTLKKTISILEFFKRRFLRLFPSILFASIITYLFFKIFNFYFSEFAKLANFIPSLTFVRPFIYNYFFYIFKINKTFDYINGSFWSLWPEVQFYIYAGFIYFLNKKNFLKNIFYISTILIFFNAFLEFIISDKNYIKSHNLITILSIINILLKEGFTLLKYLPFFLIGIFFYSIYEKKNSGIFNYISHETVAIIIFVIYQLFFFNSNKEKIIFILMLFLFLLFIFTPYFLKTFTLPIFTIVGQSSYFLYLIHENIGVFMIARLSSLLNTNNFLVPIFVIVFMIILSVFYTKYVEVVFTKWLKKIMFK